MPNLALDSHIRSVGTQPKGKTMKVAVNVLRVIQERIAPTINNAHVLHTDAINASRKIYDANEAKGFKLNGMQVKKIEKILLQGHAVGIGTLRTAAQEKTSEKNWKEHRAREGKSDTNRRKILDKMDRVHSAVLADIELCDCECEQRVIVATFLKHDLTKPWKISKCQPEVPCD
jgi:hypothetical protein